MTLAALVSHMASLASAQDRETCLQTTGVALESILDLRSAWLAQLGSDSTVAFDCLTPGKAPRPAPPSQKTGLACLDKSAPGWLSNGPGGTGSYYVVPLAGSQGSQTPTLVLSTSSRPGTAATGNMPAQPLVALATALRERLAAISLRDELRRDAALLDQSLDSVPLSVLVVDGKGNLLAWNSNAEFLFSLQRIMHLGEPYAEVLPADAVEAVSSLLDGGHHGEDKGERDLMLKLADGTSVRVGMNCAPLSNRVSEAQTAGTVILCRELSMRAEMERLHRVDQLKSDFVGAVSHELKTPLTTILGGCEALKLMASDLPEDMQQMLRSVEEGGSRIRALVADLLDLAWLEGGRVMLKRRRCDLAELLREAVEDAKPVSNGRHEFVVDLAPDLGHPLLDADKMRQVFVNLLTNAIKYSPDGGLVSIEAHKWTDDAAEITVSDQGLGIPAKHLAKIWDKFARIHPRAGSEGTGLGLPIVKLLVDFHGGRVSVKSQEGEGSTFTVTLPI